MGKLGADRCPGGAVKAIARLSSEHLHKGSLRETAGPSTQEPSHGLGLWPGSSRHCLFAGRSLSIRGSRASPLTRRMQPEIRQGKQQPTAFWVSLSSTTHGIREARNLGRSSGQKWQVALPEAFLL